MKYFFISCFVFGFAGAVSAEAEEENPFVRSSDRGRLEAEASAFLDAGEPLVQDVARSTVGIYFENRRICYGVALSETLVATKWSEIEPVANRGLFVLGHDQQVRELTRVASFQKEHDLVLMEVAGDPLVAVDMKPDVSMEAGDVLLVPRFDGKVSAAGVLSVLPRSLRSEDKGYLGVGVDFTNDVGGAEVTTVVQNSAAAEAGFQVGDIVTRVGDVEIRSGHELSNRLKQLRADQEVEIVFSRGGEVRKTRVKLKGLDVGERPVDRRAEHMKRMGLQRLSERSEGYTNVIQTDLDVTAREAGAPVVNLEGDVIGMVISRASRIKTYVLPNEVIVDALELLEKE